MFNNIIKVYLITNNNKYLYLIYYIIKPVSGSHSLTGIHLNNKLFCVLIFIPEKKLVPRRT